MKKSSNITRRAVKGQATRPSTHGTQHDHAAEIIQARRRLPSPRAVNELAGLFDALSNPLRLQIMLALRAVPDETSPELCVSDLATLIDASESLTSHQLRILRDFALVTQRRAGKLILYRSVPGPVDHLLGDGLSYIARS